MTKKPEKSGVSLPFAGERIIGRRTVLKTAGAFVATAPFVITNPARAAGQVVVRTPGGAYEEAITKTIYDPFTKETGIEVIKVAATIGKLLAMFKSGNVELDVIDTDQGPLLNLGRQGALAPIDYAGFKLTNPDDIDPSVRTKEFCGAIYFSSVISYNTDSFPTGSHPKSWADFWDVQRFPGPRTLPDMAAGRVALEFALLADGMPVDKLYPIDLDRAFKSLDRIRPHIAKFWDTGAISVQMMVNKDVVLGDLWSARLQTAKDNGAPLAIEWNQAMLQVQGFSIFKDAKNKDNAKRLIDFALQPQSQAAFLSAYPYGPTNRKALALMKPEVIQRLPSSPEHLAQSFHLNVDWWEDNRQMVSNRWSQWLLRRT